MCFVLVLILSFGYLACQESRKWKEILSPSFGGFAEEGDWGFGSQIEDKSKTYILGFKLKWRVLEMGGCGGGECFG